MIAKIEGILITKIEGRRAPWARSCAATVPAP